MGVLDLLLRCAVDQKTSQPSYQREQKPLAERRLQLDFVEAERQGALVCVEPHVDDIGVGRRRRLQPLQEHQGARGRDHGENGEDRDQRYH